VGAVPLTVRTADGKTLDALLGDVCEDAAEGARERLRRVSLADLAAE
jgi:hypothetical protein